MILRTPQRGRAFLRLKIEAGRTGRSSGFDRMGKKRPKGRRELRDAPDRYDGIADNRPHPDIRLRAVLFLMLWIKYCGMEYAIIIESETTANGNRVEEIRDIAARFIRAGLLAPRQLILDSGKDLNEFYRLTKRS